MLVFGRAMRLALRNPVWVILGLVQPVLYLSLFGPLLRKLPLAGPHSTAADNWRIFVPGLLVQLGLFGAAFVGFGLVAEWRAGVIERMRVSPASRTALLLGRVLRDVVVLLVQATILVAVAVPFGLRVNAVRAAVAVLLVATLGAAFSSLSYAAALTLKSEDALAPLLNGLATDFMRTNVIGDVNVAYLFALSQFFMAWILAWLYVRRASAVFDPLAERVRERARSLIGRTPQP